MSRFSRTLARLRHEAGFPTAYAFYHRSGGLRSFPFTFAHYRQLERGKHLPRPQWLPALMDLLRLPQTDARRRGFVVDFLRALFVTEGNYEFLVAPLMQEFVQTGCEKQASNLTAGKRACRLTPKQYQAVATDAATYWTFECLMNDRGAWRAEDLAEMIDLPEDQIEAGLRRLASHKLARRNAVGSYRGALVTLSHAPCSESPSNERRKIDRYIDEMVARRGHVLHESGITLRVEAESMRRALTALRTAMDAAVSHSVPDKAEGSGFVIFQIHARKVFDI